MIPWKMLDPIVEEDEENGAEFRNADHYNYSQKSRLERTDEVTFYDTDEISSEELLYRIRSFYDPRSILKYKLTCTSCGRPINRLVKKGKPIVHPLMKTLICKICYEFYTNGEFSVDEDGTDKYCRWCGQGGKLYLCSISPHAFCRKCVRRNIKKSVRYMNLLDSWICFICDIKPLYQLRAQCWAAQQYAAFLAQDSNCLIMTALNKSPSILNIENCEIATSAVSSKRQELIEEKDSYTGQFLRKGDENFFRCESDDHNENCARNLPSGVRACRIEAAKAYLLGIATNTSDLSKEAHIRLQKCIFMEPDIQSINSVESVLDMSTKLSSLISKLELGICSMRKGLEKYIDKWYEAVKEDEEEGAAAKRSRAWEKKNEVEDTNRNPSPNQQHTQASMFHPTSCTSHEDSFACQSTSQAWFEGRRNSLDFGVTEDLSFVDQFLIPTTDIPSDQDSENVNNPFGSFESDDQWVAPPEIESNNFNDIQGIAENRRALLLLSSKQTENTSSPNRITWSNFSEIHSDFAQNDRPFDFLNQNDVLNRLSFSNELPEEEGRWINLADVAEQIGK